MTSELSNCTSVHPDFKSHIVGSMSFGTRAVLSIRRKQKLNTRKTAVMVSEVREQREELLSLGLFQHFDVG